MVILLAKQNLPFVTYLLYHNMRNKIQCLITAQLNYITGDEAVLTVYRHNFLTHTDDSAVSAF